MALTKIPANMLSGVDLGDSVRVNLGTDNDLALFHTGGNGVIHNTTGELRIRANNLKLQDYTNEDLMIVATSDGSVDLYHNNQKKFETSATGASVTGNLAVSGNLTVSGTTTELDTTNLNVTDKNITLNYHASNDTSSNADGAGITIQDAVDASNDATLTWNTSLDKFDLSHGLHIGSSAAIGSATTPALQIGGTTTYRLGMYTDSETAYVENKNGDDGIVFRVKTTGEAMRIQSSGNVDLYQGKNLTWRYAAGSTIRGSISVSSADDMTFSTGSSNTERMRIDTNGNVGIDETTPLAKLHVVGGRANGTVYNTIIAAGGVNSTDGSGARLILTGCENDPLARGTVIEGISTGTGNSHKLNFKTNNGSNTPSTRMTIGHTGNVGIGTSSPSAKCHLYTSTSNAINLGIQNSQRYWKIETVSEKLSIADVSAGGLARMTFDTSGKVGIGTGSPTTALTVATSANISQVALTSSSNAVAWDAGAAANAYHVTTENTTFSAPSNAVEGAIISVEIAQGGTARTIAWNTVFEFAASTAPTVTATANKTDIFTFRYNGSVWQEIGRVQNMAQT